MSANHAGSYLEENVGPKSPQPVEGRFFQNTVENQSVHGNSVEEKRTISVSVESLDGKRSATTLQTALQTWCSKQIPPLTLENALSLSDGSTMFDISPAPDVKMLRKLEGRTLTTRKGETVKITSIEFKSALPVTVKVPVDVSVDEPGRVPVDEPGRVQESEHMPSVEQSDMKRSAEALAESETCLLSVSLYWYLSHICKKEIEEILDKNGVTLEPELKLSFRLRGKDGNPANAVEEFTKLTQKALSESNTATIPAKHLNVEKLVETLNMVKAPGKKCLLVHSSQEMTVHGPITTCNTIHNALTASQVTVHGEGPELAPRQKPSDLVLNIKDPLSKEGLTMEKSDWDKMAASLAHAVSGIEAKFGVQFKSSNPTKGKVTVKAHYRALEENPSMESHATRALVRLYQKFVASQRPKKASSTAPHSNSQSTAEPRLTAVGAAVSNGRSKGAVAMGLEGGASGGESEVEKCPICLDSVTDKTQLKCKHTFCEGCLAEAVRNQGEICPVCKYVFGTVEGNQPDGHMDVNFDKTSLPGFKGYGTIRIIYQIPAGLQTEKHPNPGRRFDGTRRTAYLPDNAEGNEVLKLLRIAFDRRLIFTVGTSRSSGIENQVTWNDIHHKTSTDGGASMFGYPDATYLARVKAELKSKGVV